MDNNQVSSTIAVSNTSYIGIVSEVLFPSSGEIFPSWNVRSTIILCIGVPGDQVQVWDQDHMATAWIQCHVVPGITSHSHTITLFVRFNY